MSPRPLPRPPGTGRESMSGPHRVNTVAHTPVSFGKALDRPPVRSIAAWRRVWPRLRGGTSSPRRDLDAASTGGRAKPRSPWFFHVEISRLATINPAAGRGLLRPGRRREITATCAGGLHRSRTSPAAANGLGPRPLSLDRTARVRVGAWSLCSPAEPVRALGTRPLRDPPPPGLGERALELKATPSRSCRRRTRRRRRPR